MKGTGKVVKKTGKARRQHEQLPPRTEPSTSRDRDLTQHQTANLRTVEGLIEVMRRNPAMTMTDIANKLYVSESPWPMVKFLELWQDHKIGLTASHVIQVVFAFQLQ